MSVSLGVKNQLFLTGVTTPLSAHPHPTHPAGNTHALTRLGTKINKEINEIVSELTDCLGSPHRPLGTGWGKRCGGGGVGGEGSNLIWGDSVGDKQLVSSAPTP